MHNQWILFSFSSRFAAYLNVSVTSQGSAAAYLRCGGKCNFVGNFFIFTAVKKIGKIVKILDLTVIV